MITAGSHSFVACPVLTETSDDTGLSAIASSDQRKRRRKWKKKKGIRPQHSASRNSFIPFFGLWVSCLPNKQGRLRLSPRRHKKEAGREMGRYRKESERKYLGSGLGWWIGLCILFLRASLCASLCVFRWYCVWFWTKLHDLTYMSWRGPSLGDPMRLTERQDPRAICYRENNSLALCSMGCACIWYCIYALVLETFAPVSVN